ncbi:MFS transporter [Actinomadura parmotrematis]|uniref:MFS transporter n=1 Tax=Actinomadura parmotrematis TaxID=2864039 RepID=A0ABS7FVT6_9ACTN|nr:MFS transporter [Actinomadura parmotrematis]MBW8484535.1 MFS transporter [Actinomadura parmotrematis]
MAPPGTRSPRRWLALAALTLSVLIIGLDGTVITVALPTLARDLGASAAELQWINGGYLLALSVALLPAGKLGDRFGQKRLLLAGIALFGAASLAGAFAATTGQVIAVRALLGLGAAAIMPLSMAILPRLFAPDELSRAIAVWTAGTALGMPAGPLVGGWLLDSFSWGAVFLFNVPVAAAALAAAAWLLPADGPAGRAASGPFDLAGTLLGAAGITAVVYSTIRVPAAGWGDPAVLATLAGGAVLLVLFVRRQRRHPDPLVDVGLFAGRAFRWGALAAVFVNFAVMGLLFVVPQYLQDVLGGDALSTGLRVLPLIGGLMAAATLSEALVPKLGARAVIAAGLVLLGGGALLGATTAPSDGYAFTAAWLSVAGLGFGLAMVPATSLAVGALPAEGTGAGTSLLETVQQLGGVLGVAGLGSLLNAGYRSRLPAGAPAATRDSVAAANGDPAALAAFVHGMDLVLAFCGATALAVAVLAAVLLPRRAPAPELPLPAPHPGQLPV